MGSLGQVYDNFSIHHDFYNGRTVSFCLLLFSQSYPNVYPLFASDVDIHEFGK